MMKIYEVTTLDDDNPKETIRARHCKDEDGALFFYNDTLIRAFACGSWHGLRIIGEGSGDPTDD